MLTLEAKAKWSAWKELEGMTQEEAKEEYVRTAIKLMVFTEIMSR